MAWADEGDKSDKDGTRPSSVTVRLKDGGTTVASIIVSLNDRDRTIPINGT